MYPFFCTFLLWSFCIWVISRLALTKYCFLTFNFLLHLSAVTVFFSSACVRSFLLKLAFKISNIECVLPVQVGYFTVWKGGLSFEMFHIVSLLLPLFKIMQLNPKQSLLFPPVVFIPFDYMPIFLHVLYWAFILQEFCCNKIAPYSENPLWIITNFKAQ